MESAQMRAARVGPHLTLVLIWWAFTFSIIILGAILYIVLPIPSVMGVVREESPAAAMLVFMAVVAGVVSFMLFCRNSRRQQAEAKAAVDGAPNRQRCEAMRILPNRIVAFTLNETVAIFGFMLALFEKEPERFLPFGGAALALALIMYPWQRG